MVPSGEMTVKDPSEELGIKDSTLRRRAREYEGMGDDAFPGNGSPKVNKDHETVKLEKKVEEPGRERERDTERSPGLLEPRPCARFELLGEHRGGIGPVKKACGLMEVSRSGFYGHLGRKKPNAQIGRGAPEGFAVEAFERARTAAAAGASTASCEKAASP